MNKLLNPLRRPTLLCAALLSTTLLAATAQAATVKFPAELPPFGQDKPLTVPKITQQTLPNGLQVWVVPKQGVPRVDFVLAPQAPGA